MYHEPWMVVHLQRGGRGLAQRLALQANLRHEVLWWYAACTTSRQWVTLSLYDSG